MIEGDGDIIGFVETFKNNNKSYIVKYDTINKLIVVYEPNKQMRHGVRVRTMYVPNTDDKYENLLKQIKYKCVTDKGALKDERISCIRKNITRSIS